MTDHHTEQLALYLNARDSREYGTAAWGDLDLAGQEAYLTDATAILAAMKALGWAPAHTPTDDEREAITDEALWDFANDLFEAWNIEDLNSPSLAEDFRDRFVRRFRRSEVPEPSAAREFLEAALAESDADEAEGGAGWDVEVDARTVLELLEEHSEPQGEPSDAISIPRPHVPFGPEGVPEHEADADYLDHAAASLEGHYEVGGSNVRATVVKMLRDAASALRAASSVTEQGENR